MTNLKIKDDSVCIRHEPCPQCGSRDNLARYSDGHAYCFGFNCGYYEPPTDVIKPLSMPVKKNNFERAWKY